MQSRLLGRAAQWLKPGGALVYSVCSLEPEEGERVISASSPKTHPPEPGELPDFVTPSPEGWVRILPGLISMPMRQNTSSSTLQSNTTPERETNAKSIADWTLREVANGTAVLQGPSGILKATTGDAVAGLGKVTAIVRWGKGWVVVTSVGYCTSTPLKHADGTCKPYSGASH